MQRALRILGHQRLINRWKVGVVWRLAPPFSFSRPFECRYADLSYQGVTDHFGDWWLYFFGVYEPEIAKLLRDQAERLRRERGSITFIDIGANVGMHSLHMAQVCDRVIAFEPNPVYAERLRGNVERNNLGNVELRQVGLGAEQGRIAYATDADVSTGHFAKLSKQQPGMVELPVRTGDDALADVPQIDLIKIDVDGFDPEVLRGLRDRLHRDRPTVAIEWTPCHQVRAGVSGDLRALLYPDHRLQRVALDRWTWGYRLQDHAGVDFPEGSTYFLITPA